MKSLIFLKNMKKPIKLFIHRLKYKEDLNFNEITMSLCLKFEFEIIAMFINLKFIFIDILPF